MTAGSVRRAEGAISDVIADVTGHTITSVSGVGRSGWAAQAVYETAGGPKYFVKTASESADAMFTGEALGLTALHGALLRLGPSAGGREVTLVTLPVAVQRVMVP